MSDALDPQETIGALEEWSYKSDVSVPCPQEILDAITLLKAQQARISDLEVKLSLEGGYKRLLDAAELINELNEVRIAELVRHSTTNIQAKFDELTRRGVFVDLCSTPTGLFTILVLAENLTVNSEDETDHFTDVASALDWALWRESKPMTVLKRK